MKRADTVIATLAREETSRRRARAPRCATILGIGTAVPPSVSQSALAALTFRTAFGFATPGEEADRKFQWVRRVFARTGIERRGSVLKPNAGVEDLTALGAFFAPSRDPHDRGPSTSVRMARYAIEAPRLAISAAIDALGRAGVSAESVTHLVTVSCTGFASPGWDVELIRGVGIPATVRRTNVGFMGCHAAFNALAVASAIVTADPAAVVLVCCVELCTLHLGYGDDAQRIVANALFADGAAAAVVGSPLTSGRRPGRSAGAWAIHAFASTLVPGTIDAMTWHIGDNGFEMTLSSALPSIVERGVGAWCENWLREAGLSPEGVDAWAVHPGGPKVLSAATAGLNLEAAALKRSRDVLARHGNMSSTTILFILRDLLADVPVGGTCVALGFGPGLTMEGMALRSR